MTKEMKKLVSEEQNIHLENDSKSKYNRANSVNSKDIDVYKAWRKNTKII